MRLTRDRESGPATDSAKYQEIGDQVHECLAFTYFYPALKSNDGYRVAWPWENESAFRRRFLGSYAGTALTHPQHSAAEGTLHEVEFLSPRAQDTGEPVFLMGYIFEKQDCSLKWQSALRQVQMGGERGYGWGNVELEDASSPTGGHLFDGVATFKGDGDRPIISSPEKGHLLAHTLVENLAATGEMEPLVGREWRSNNARHRYAGQHVAFCALCFVPGSTMNRALDFLIGKFGVWRWSDTAV